MSIAARLQVYTRRHEFDERLRVGVNVAADAHLSDGGIFKFETPAALLRDTRDRFVERLAVERPHVVASCTAAWDR